VLRAARTWNPASYLDFADLRLRPALELLTRIPDDRKVNVVVDLGCGPGNVSPFLRSRWPDASIWCVDSSDSMLQRAKADHHKTESMTKNMFYRQADFESFRLDHPVDVIYSNAALHWVSFELHKQLFPRLLSQLAPDGVLALQMPDTRRQPSHLLMREAGRQAGFDDKLAKVRWSTTEVDPEAYYDLLQPLCKSIEMWSTSYCQILEGDDPVYEFTRTSGLGPYVEALGSDTADAKKFVDKYKELLRVAYPKHRGRTLFNFNRFFLIVKNGPKSTL